ncbi:Glycosyl hydrolase family 32 [Trypanosoma melophagium]|uniref:Glycosyl hydrolase family 32 n=1 Tax=Trypanosoma melophagium TaxID=715481 RepID=UPI00351A38FA|nr:Glycosyl hydrolase family 32 [Trypanosoma melophagium]
MHLYMQYNPDDSVWGNINWYHFTSNDYVKWQDQGIALKNDNTYDRRGAYSGSITQGADGTPVVMYTCAADGDEQRQCIAVPPRDDVKAGGPRSLNSFVKLSTNPVLTENDVPGLLGLNHFRGPTNFWVNPDNTSEWLVAFAATANDASSGAPKAQVVVFSTSDPNFRSGFRFSHAIWDNSFEFDNMVSTMISGQDYWVYGNYVKNPINQTVYEEDFNRGRTYIDYGRWYASKQNHDPILNRTILWG